MDDAEIRTRKWTRPEYDRLIEAEFFGPDDRIELIGGHMTLKEPQHSPHAAAIIRVHRVLSAAFGSDWLVRMQMALALDDESEPEPDISVVPADPDDYEVGYPTTASLVVEVALSRLRFDRQHKSSLYARARIADYWIVNLAESRLEVFRDPVVSAEAAFGWRYAQVITLGRTEHVTPLALPSASIAVTSLLSRIRTP